MSEPISYCERCGTHRDLLGPSDEDVFRRCGKCGLSVCPNCWNQVKGLCLADAPFELGTTSPRSRKVKPAALAAASAMGVSMQPAPPATSTPAGSPAPPTVPADGSSSGGFRISVPRPHLAIPALPVRAFLRGSAVLALLCLTLVLGWQVVAFVGRPGEAPAATPAAGDATPAPRAAGAPLFPASASPEPSTAPAHPAAGGTQPGGAKGGHGPAPTPHRTPAPPQATPSAQPTDAITPPPTEPPTPTPEPTEEPTPEPLPTPTDTPPL